MADTTFTLGFSKIEGEPTMSNADKRPGGLRRTVRFKTNINCSGCVNAVRPHLGKAEGILKWTVDTTNPEKILTIDAEGLGDEELKLLWKGPDSRSRSSEGRSEGLFRYPQHFY